ncbi:hypothetical protein ACO22_03939 [Paracoccidioides brasiliensis]|uniref:Rhodopsin domain-containing protein n=1 Tax=Paracoccidioides brasiliensis TaxID=121759 RepID=A0A1D2JEQ3_PARBR|nr:hypothetical protein ACO22_03939 [Paracoccidioides brasiliensis]ODH47833.1 hypothetical protein GX48_06032 [Paracoccidioides brasiliensis]
MIKSPTRSWGPDDSWMAFAFLPLMCRCVSMIRVFTLRLSPSIDDQVLAQKLILCGRVFYALYLWCMKLCLLRFYKRLETGSNKVHYSLQVLRVFIVVTFLATLAATVLECKPLYIFWDHDYLRHPCRKGMSNLLTMGALNIATDLALILFPIPMLWRMTSLDFQAKIQLTLLFLVGTLVIAITITRLPLILNHSVAQSTRSLGSTRLHNQPSAYVDPYSLFQLSSRRRDDREALKARLGAYGKLPGRYSTSLHNVALLSQLNGIPFTSPILTLIPCLYSSGRQNFPGSQIRENNIFFWARKTIPASATKEYEYGAPNSFSSYRLPPSSPINQLTKRSSWLIADDNYLTMTATFALAVSELDITLVRTRVSFRNGLASLEFPDAIQKSKGINAIPLLAVKLPGYPDRLDIFQY